MTDAATVAPPFVTFYSFKGGVGRTMALVNVASLLARRGFRVLMIDFDLEAPGATYLLTPGEDGEPPEQFGIVDLLNDAKSRGQNADLFASDPKVALRRAVHQLTFADSEDAQEGGLWIMPAGRMDGGYIKQLGQLSLGSLYEEGFGQPLIARLKEVICGAGLFDIVLVDSRTGFSDESGICTRDLADSLVVVMGLNRQNRCGTASFLAALKGAGAAKPMAVVLSPVPSGEDELFEQRLKQAERALSDARGAPVNIEMEVPYHPRLALIEEPVVLSKRRTTLIDAYGRLEQAVLDLCDWTVEKLTARLRVAAEARDLESTIILVRTLSRIEGGARWIARLATPERGSQTTTNERGQTVIELPNEPRHLLTLMEQEEAGVLRGLVAAVLVADRDETTLMRLTDRWVKREGSAGKRQFLDALASGFQDSAVAQGTAANHYRALVLPKAAIAAYERSLGLAVNDHRYLCNYALFLTEDQQEHDRAEEMYERAIKADPNNGNALGNYAVFLTNIRQEHDRAEEMFARAIVMQPNSAGILGNYANFLTQVRRSYDRAQELHEKALSLDPTNANLTANYARRLFITGNFTAAHKRLDAAFDAFDETTGADVRAECWMYAYCHCNAARQPEALRQLRSLIQDGVRTGAWSYEGVVAAVTSHPEEAWLSKLADVLADKRPAADLDPWLAWADAARS